MLTSRPLATLLAACVGPLAAGATLHHSGTDGPITRSSGIVPCDALMDAGLGDRLLFPTDAGYDAQVTTWWSENARLRPFCLVLPLTTDEVSTALTTLINVNRGAGDWHIAVRSGGHGWPGSNNIANGVTIDLSMMNTTTYDPMTNVAGIQPGGRWGKVYADLEEHAVTVTGGRDGGVGVGGYLLGGGLSFFLGRRGFACDSVVNFEVVLANGTVINANSSANADLWLALKGGGSNFGVVTQFDLEAIPSMDMYYNIRFLSSHYTNAIIETVSGFADLDEALADNALVTFYTHDTSVNPEISVAAVHVNTQGDPNQATPFDPLNALPALSNFTVMQTMAEAAAGSQIEGGTRNAGATLTLRNDPELLRLCVELHHEYVEALKTHIDPDDFTTLMFLQPVPSYTTRIGQQRGGNVLGLEGAGNIIIWTAGVSVRSDQREFAVAQAELHAMKARVKKLSREMNGDVDFVYLNYAEAVQDPLGSYGAANVKHLRDVAARYDPAGVFQTRVLGGFKISRAE